MGLFLVLLAVEKAESAFDLLVVDTRAKRKALLCHLHLPSKAETCYGLTVVRWVEVQQQDDLARRDFKGCTHHLHEVR
jgi:hypothetical protein